MGRVRLVLRAASVALSTLGPAVALQACRDEPTFASAPFTVEPSLAAPPGIAAGRLIDPSPTFVVRDASGRALANFPVAVTITAGKGTLRNAPIRSGEGPTSIGTWTLDTIAGLNSVTITAGSAPPVVISVEGLPDLPARIHVDGGDQVALAGDLLPVPVDFRVVDRYGNAIPGIQIGISVAAGSGVLSGESVTSSRLPGAASVTWRLGARGGRQLLAASAVGLDATVEAVIRSEYAPLIRFQGPLPRPEVEEVLRKAVDRARAFVTGDAPDVPVFNFDMSRCGLPGPMVTETIDDLIIFAEVAPLDGTGKVLASAGPCITRTASGIPVIGIMRFDSDDVSSMLANGSLEAVALHEMLHILGIGSLWRLRGLVRGSGTPDPRFAGSMAVGQCLVAGGGVRCADSSVPVENVGGPGTAEVHWRESVFDAEVMTGFIEASGEMPLSAVSIASLADLGYAVNFLAADAFSFPLPTPVAGRLAATAAAPWESTMEPVFEVTPAGWVRPASRLR